jgi:cell division protein FtsQ
MLSYILSVSVFVVKRIDVSGNTLYSENYIKERSMHKGKYKKSTFYQLAMGIMDPPKNIPFVESVHYKLESPSHILLKVNEKEMLGVIQGDDGKYVYFNDDGKVVEISKVKLNGVMPVSGLTPSKPKIGESLSIDKDSLTALLNTVKALKKYDMSVDSVIFEDKNRLSCHLGDVYVKFGKYEYLNEKIMRLNIILPKLKGKKGKLHLENWSPNYTDIVFENDL